MRLRGLPSLTFIALIVGDFGPVASSTIIFFRVFTQLLRAPRLFLFPKTHLSIRNAACKALGSVMLHSPCWQQDLPPPEADAFVRAIVRAAGDRSQPVRVTAFWALANCCSSLQSGCPSLPSATVFSLLIQAAVSGTSDCDRVQFHAARALNFLAPHLACDAGLQDVAVALASCLRSASAKVQWNAAIASASLFKVRVTCEQIYAHYYYCCWG